MFDDLAGYFALGQAVFLLLFSARILIFYFRTETQHSNHITSMAASYILLTFIVAFTVNFRIFYEGASREVGIILALTAFILGDIGLIRMWTSRKRK